MKEDEKYDVQWLLKQLACKRSSINEQIKTAMRGDRFADVEYFTEKLKQLDELERKVRSLL